MTGWLPGLLWWSCSDWKDRHRYTGQQMQLAGGDRTGHHDTSTKGRTRGEKVWDSWMTNKYNKCNNITHYQFSNLYSFSQACYGRSDAESVERVKALYDTLEMPVRYYQHEEESYHRLQKLIQLHAKNLPHAVFLNFAKKIYKRNKWGVVRSIGETWKMELSIFRHTGLGQINMQWGILVFWVNMKMVNFNCTLNILSGI